MVGVSIGNMTFRKSSGPIDPRITLLARECINKIQGCTARRTIMIDQSTYDVHNEMVRLRRIIPDHGTTPTIDPTTLATIGRFLPAPGRQILCFYCLTIITMRSDQLEETVKKSRITPSSFTACCSRCYNDVFVL